MSRSLRFALLLLLAATVAALSGCSNDDSTTSPPVATGPNFDLRFPATGTSQQVSFITVGSWAYRCVPHAGGGMTGTVNVEAAAPNDSAVVQVGPGDALSFSPATVTIKPGGYVRWVNVSSMTNHTVTR